MSPDVESAHSFSVSLRVRSLYSPSWLVFKSLRLCTLPSISNLCSVVQERSRPLTHTEIHPIQVHAEINLHTKYTYLTTPGVRSSVFSFGPPLPDPKRHFCNSMQASELCQKELASLKADLCSKVGASLTGSTFPSAGSRSESLFSFMCEDCFRPPHASMKPLNQFIKCKGPSVGTNLQCVSKYICCLGPKGLSGPDPSAAPQADVLRRMLESVQYR